MKNRGLYFGIAGFAIFMVIVYVMYTKLGKDYAPGILLEENSGQQQEQSQKQKAPDFTVLDKNGNQVRLSDLSGKPVILNFWATWCSPCKAEMPDFEDKFKELGEEINFVMVNATDGQRDTVEKAKEFVEKEGYTFPIYFDTEYDAISTYGVSGFPTTYFIDKDGYLVAHAFGMLNKESLETGIEMILSQ